MKNRIQIVLIVVIMISSLNTMANKPLFSQSPGMVSFTYRNSFSKDVAATLDTIKSLGITDMEFSSLFNRTAADIRKILDERGMICSSFGVSYEDFTTKTRKVGQDAKTLGAEFVRVASVPHDGIFTLEMAKQTVAAFNEFGKLLKDEFGITFCFHNHGYEFAPYKDGTLYDYLIQNTDPKYVSFEIDILWTYYPGADPVALITKYGNRFKLLHLKDLKKGVTRGTLRPYVFLEKTPKENDVALGTGQLDIPAILKAAKKSSIKHYYIEDESPSYAKQVPQTIAFLNSLEY